MFLRSNFFTQISGNKTFSLYNPSAYKNLYLYPSIHPARRQSQIEQHNEIEVASMKAHLQSGDVLYIPPFWFHTVRSDSKHSISLSTISASRLEYIWSSIMYKNIPFYKLTIGIDRVLGVRIYIEALLHALDIESKVLMTSLIDSRYRKIFKSVDDSIPTKLLDVNVFVDADSITHHKRFNCNDFSRLKQVAVVLSKRDKMNKKYAGLGNVVDAVANTIISFKKRYFLQKEVLEILLHDYVEEMLRYAVSNPFDIAVAIHQCFLL